MKPHMDPVSTITKHGQVVSHAQAGTVSAKRRNIVLGAIITATIVLVALAAILLLSRAESGDQIMREGNVEDVREAVKILMDSYTEMITLFTASFGVVAFLITFRQSQLRRLTTRNWTILTVGIVLLGLALFLAFVGREELLVMLTNNAVDIALPALSVTRWLCYLCFILSAALISAFAVELAVPTNSNHRGGSA